MGRQILADSDILVAAYRPEDANYQKAASTLSLLGQQEAKIFASNLVLQESSTVISYKMGMPDVRKFYLSVSSVVEEVISISERIESESWKLFLKQTKKGTSFVDCVNVVIFKELKLDAIVSFDKFYKQLGINCV